jgi:hypothetical protein
MKQFFLVVSLSLAVVLTAAASPAPKNDPRVEKAFSKLFAGASNVSWSKVEGNYMKASFIWADHQTVAFFGSDANLIGSIRGLFFNQLPLSVIRSFNSSYSDHVVLEVREISNDEGVNYTLLTEHKNKKYRIRISGTGDVFEKVRVKK